MRYVSKSTTLVVVNWAIPFANWAIPVHMFVHFSGYCVYKSAYYSQGQTWYDECDKKCTCENVTTGYYSCSQR